VEDGGLKVLAGFEPEDVKALREEFIERLQSILLKTYGRDKYMKIVKWLDALDAAVRGLVDDMLLDLHE